MTSQQGLQIPASVSERQRDEFFFYETGMRIWKKSQCRPNKKTPSVDILFISSIGSPAFVSELKRHNFGFCLFSAVSLLLCSSPANHPTKAAFCIEVKDLSLRVKSKVPRLYRLFEAPLILKDQKYRASHQWVLNQSRNSSLG
ncbi:hypothetical protein NPIL_90461 [Nephila pilipes]|uniref:Uncharacterized protein n=1 Tax=Nephila pilipes TaxID=299642 RepID=A0A8X6Q871_NEPPI|nr:hypothetical protein NPIL_90461 [Nephila pilipes]